MLGVSFVLCDEHPTSDAGSRPPYALAIDNLFSKAWVKRTPGHFCLLTFSVGDDDVNGFGCFFSSRKSTHGLAKFGQ
jgi:hypothetical protein